MAIVIALPLAALLLWAWLIGHWFARVLVFLLLAPAIFLATNAPFWSQESRQWINTLDQTTCAVIAIVQIVFAIAVAWFVSGLPQQQQRRRALRHPELDAITAMLRRPNI